MMIASGFAGPIVRGPIPNVRAIGEMDDRLELIEAEVEIQIEGRSEPLRHYRRGPVWLGLVCGMHFEIPLLDDGP